MSASLQGWSVVVRLGVVKADCLRRHEAELVLLGYGTAQSRPFLFIIGASDSRPLHSMTPNGQGCSVMPESARVFPEYASSI